MSFDNPFLTRDLRRKRFGASSPLWVGVLLVAAAALLMLAPVVLALTEAAVGVPFNRPRWPTVATLAVVHAFGCLFAGAMAGSRVLHVERRDDALWAIRLLPQKTRRIVWLQLCLPLYTVALVALAGLPAYVLAALLSLGSATYATSAFAGVAWVAGLALPLGIVASAPSSGGEVSRPGPDANEPNESLAPALAFMLGIAAIAVGVVLVTSPERMPFFGQRVPAWPAALLLLVAAWIAADACCADALNGESSVRPRLPAVGAGSMTLLGVGGVGAFWGRLPGQVWLIAGAVIVALAVIVIWKLKAASRSVREREDPWSVTELEWIFGRCEAPLLQRDLRAALRVRSLRRSWLHLALALPVVATIAYVALTQFSGVRVSIMWPILNVLIAGQGQQAASNWIKERERGTLACLKLCPMSARELLGERLAAAYIREAPAAVFSWVVVLALVGWACSLGHWIAAPLALALTPLWTGYSIWSACQGCAPNMVGAPFYKVVRGVVFCAAPCALIGLLALRGFGPWICFGLGLAWAALNAWFAALTFQELARRFELSRTVDWDQESS